MRRGVLHALAWTAATGAAVAVSWFGVHTVLSGTVYDRPRALPLTEVAPEPQAASTHRPKPSPSPTPTPSRTPPSPTPDPPSRPATPTPEPPPPSPEPPPAEPAGDPATGVKGYTVAGGQVVLDIGPDSADFVSATPSPGWTMQVWTREESGGSWIRVTFTHGERSSSVFCSWNGYPPRVDIDEQ
ncbi:hypothetical protein ACWGUP_07005 [Streptomyces diastaticus]|uniref:Secreted protein n=1 Tax=Streptomyces rutgersensis TaxID=53451 RepID=A0ABX6RLH5_9ACTN|nr:hypothetical protein [Streptomyces rutgersensis]NEE26976.1 hypothetical protein [Streptomyces sp. SID7982]QNE81236.1 hypothetical protein F0345_09070 [Streptomyces rutgersensis]